ncbi:MAG: tRNA pseudouridine(38-40) synthase TruA [Ferruginibacter sp.]
MPRYFVEVSYKGDRYAGFQAQKNANTIQAEVEKALNVFFGINRDDTLLFIPSEDEEVQEVKTIMLTGASRTDSGVHARQNYFHFDTNSDLEEKHVLGKCVYNINAILPADIMIRAITRVADASHCRFDALSRTYQYSVYHQKNPFLTDRAFFYPYPLNGYLLKEAADKILKHSHFEAFSKKRTQVHTFNCNIIESEWMKRDDVLIYRVTANRFLRGMVRGLVGTMLAVGKEKISINAFSNILLNNDSSPVDFSVPAHGLCLMSVNY